VRMASSAQLKRQLKRVYFIRHGQSVANWRKCDTLDERDAKLTGLGRRQAACWHAPGALEAVFGNGRAPGVCICSPLRRAMETAALVFENEPRVPIECTRLARERWWTHYQCVGSEYDETVGFASGLGRRVGGLDDLARLDKFWDPSAEIEEIARVERENDSAAAAEQKSKYEPSAREEDANYLSELTTFLIGHAAKTLAVACHWGVINELTGASPNNCDIVVADLNPGDRSYSIVEQLEPPGDIERSI
jgi:hypothetical protein